MRLSANAEKVQGIYYSAHRCATCAAVCLTGCTCKCTTQDSCPVESAMPECGASSGCICFTLPAARWNQLADPRGCHVSKCVIH